MNGDDTPKDEAFFSRWSRRKQQAKRVESAGVAEPAPPPQPVGAAGDPAAPHPQAGSAQTGTPPAATPKQLTEDDFKDVDFAKLDYASDYSRFTQPGVPEHIRQKALTQLWHSDPIFTQVDPFQDYAGDYTDAATVPTTALKTAYRVGQGFLSDREAHAWDRLGKPDVAPEIAALPELRPGYRVRAITTDDTPALVAVQVVAISSLGAEAYDSATAESWAHGLTPELIVERIAAGAIGDVAIDEADGTIVGMLGRSGTHIEALFVRPNHGRRGIARRLVEKTIRDIERSGASGDLSVEASRSSRALFARLGFRETGARAFPTRGGATLEVFAMTRPLVTDTSLTIKTEAPDQPAVRAFFAASERYMSGLYPAESNHFVDADALAEQNVIFLVARLHGVAVGCGAVVKDDEGTGEIKRMWVAPEARGLKLGVRLLDALETIARGDGLAVLRLETGIHQPEAIALYRRAGYVETGPFADYKPDPLSLFMEKRLA